MALAKSCEVIGLNIEVFDWRSRRLGAPKNRAQQGAAGALD
jgi:hypothetical protein